jgi:hypothetical protein
MSYTVNPYLVDLDRLRNIYGSGDELIAIDIEKSLVKEIENFNEWIDEGWPEGTPKIDEVLRANIKGLFPWAYGKAPYKGALELLCIYVGIRLPNDEFEGIHISGLKSIKGYSYFEKLVFSSPSPVAFPGSEQDNMYRVGHITFQEAQQMLADLPPVNILDIETDWFELAYAQFYSWLEASFQYRQGIVTFFS